jgi:two-component system chemotaxis response regulator CheB
MTRVRYEAVVIGASSGAVEALSEVLERLPSEFRLPIMIVVHLPADRPSALVDLFRVRCSFEVREAEDKEPVRPAVIYFAPPDYHLLVEVDKSLSLSSDEAVLYSRPSIDVLFESAADAYGPNLIGVVLTGANSDGAAGLRRIWEGGGAALVQSPDTAFSTAMPRAAIAACPAARVMELWEIAEHLISVGRSDE